MVPKPPPAFNRNAGNPFLKLRFVRAEAKESQVYITQKFSRRSACPRNGVRTAWYGAAFSCLMNGEGR